MIVEKFWIPIAIFTDIVTSLRFRLILCALFYCDKLINGI